VSYIPRDLFGSKKWQALNYGHGQYLAFETMAPFWLNSQTL